MVERILITGGTGKTGRLVAEALAQNGVQPIVASRQPKAAAQVRFEWGDTGTFDAALDGADAVYLVAPTDRTDHLTVMRPFLERAVQVVPGRLVLLSASSLKRGGPLMGEVHEWLHDNAPLWSVLRPSWFMQNFVTERLPSILQDGMIMSATGTGRVPFIDASDIAAVAVTALKSPDLPSQEHILTGPEAITYDDAAALISNVVGRPIRHEKLSVSELADHYVRAGLPKDYAPALAAMDGEISRGAEDRVTDEVELLTGRPPTAFTAFLQAHRMALIGNERLR